MSALLFNRGRIVYGKLNLDIGKFNILEISSFSYTRTQKVLKTFDEAMDDGFKPSLTILGASPAMGKSILVVQIAKYDSEIELWKFLTAR